MHHKELITIERHENGDYLIAWDDTFSRSAVKIYAGESPQQARDGVLVSTSENGTARIDSLRETVRHYFHLVPSEGASLTFGERALSVAGGTNLRDVGGYPTKDGRQVQWGKLYRSGQLSVPQGNGLDYLGSLKLKLNCDFRHANVFTANANTLPEGVDAMNLPVDAGSFSTFLQNLTTDQLTESAMIEAMCAVNRQLVTDYQVEYRKMFAALLDLKDGGFLVNCTAGKDRTGFATALILHTLGVPRDTIIYDYLLSTRYFKVDPDDTSSASITRKYSPEVLEILKSDVTKPLKEVRAEYLQAAFDAMEHLCGSVDAYIEEVYGIGEHERHQLRERYTVAI